MRLNEQTRIYLLQLFTAAFNVEFYCYQINHALQVFQNFPIVS